MGLNVAIGEQRWLIDSSWRRVGDGTVLLAGSPTRLFRVSAAGATALDQLEQGTTPPGGAALIDRLVEAGALHPAPTASHVSLDDVTFVVPCRGTLGPLPPHRTVVVDDASEPPLVASDTADVRLIRLDHNLGPAGARNIGLDAVTTPFVVFIDADVLAPSHSLEWLDPLLAHFNDARVAAVAPRIVSAPGSHPIDRYEQVASPLDLGEQPARVAPGTRVAYVPAAVLVCRTNVVRDIGGFDPTLRTGEDVDLVWRLYAAGHRVRYEPRVQLQHRPRSTWGAVARQRIGYGESAAALDQRHPGAVAPVRCTIWSLGLWALVLCRRPLVAVGIALGTAIALTRKLRGVPATTSAGMALQGHLAVGEQLARAIRRVWWPAASLLLVSRRGRRLLLAAMAAPAFVDAVRSPANQRRRVLTVAPLTAIDEMSYGAGVWRGMWKARSARALLPAISGWPQRNDG